MGARARFVSPNSRLCLSHVVQQAHYAMSYHEKELDCRVRPTAGKGEVMSCLKTGNRAIAWVLACVLAFAVAIAATAVQPVLSSSVGMPQAAYAKDVKMSNATPLKKAPKAWKKYLQASYIGHTSGVYHTDFYFDCGSFLMPYRIDGMVTTGKIEGKTKCKYTGYSNEHLSWTITRGKASAYASAQNVPLFVWDSVHGQNGYSLTKAQCKQLLKTATGGKISYAKLVKWSRAKAEKKGLKAEKKYLTKHFAKNVKPI